MRKFFVLIGLLAFLSIPACKDCHHNSTVNNFDDPEPVLTVVYDGARVVIAAHSVETAIVYRQDNAIDRTLSFVDSALIYDGVCAGEYTYILEVVNTDIVLTASVTVPEAGQSEAMVIGCIAQQEKVMVCHKGKIIEIPEAALKAHLAHGDVEGPCPKELPNNGIDDDLDGLVDCEDPDLALDPSCQPPDPPPPPVENCDNELDDDGDGLVDCMDSDCASNLSCVPPPPEPCVDTGWTVVLPKPVEPVVSGQ